MSSCRAGHDLTGANGSWQLSGRGDIYLTCRICNAKRARLWRIANAHRLRRKHTKGKKKPGQTLNRRIPP
jgi:hypothetical protein